MTDPIADMLARIKNALLLQKSRVVLPFSKIKYQIAQILEKEGFVEKIDTKGRKQRKVIRIFLKYDDQKRPLILGLKRISKPGRRIYKGYKELKPVKQGYGIAILSTCQGIITDKEAKKRKLGGEVLCEIW